MEDLLTLAEAAEALRVSQATVRRLIDAGELRGVRVGRLWRVPKAAVEAYVGGDNPLELLATLARVAGPGSDEQAKGVFRRVREELPALLEQVRQLAETGDEETRSDCQQMLDLAERLSAGDGDMFFRLLATLTVYAGCTRLLRVTH